ncbi:hypothetical protein E8E13_001896 [Curvularia kusanoi]|uniref:Alcohol dehydrogenase n=1 Tax=Curvularia kusanoi TaxID=90978 RepID=A0A9P4T2Y7_CURKU|nr:hypothetical protein E8E13_001896 [Curvularia kusanoi]
MVKIIDFAGIQIPSPGFGAMGLSFGLGSNLTLEQAEPVLLRAIELGCTFWDTAVVYQAGINEKLLGDFIRKHKVRDQVFLASKCGIAAFEDGSVTNSPPHIHSYIDGTIQRLGFTPDLYYLHRIDPETPLQESIPALDEVRRAGKTRYIGVSECSAQTLRRANSIARIDAVQAEYSAFETIHETDGLIDAAKELDIAFIAYSPLGHGWLVDDFPYKSPHDFAHDDFRRTVPKFQGENFYKNKEIVEEFKKVASRRGCTLPQIALAWVAAQGLIAIPGTTKPKRLEENWASRNIDLTDAEQQEMRALIDNAKPFGNRYNEKAQAMHRLIPRKSGRQSNVADVPENDKGPMFIESHCQRFFVKGYQSSYFVVHVASDVQKWRTQPSAQPANLVRAILAKQLHACQLEQQAADRIFGNSFTNTEVSPWRWPRYFDGLDMTQVAPLAYGPNPVTERAMVIVGDNFDRIIEQAHRPICEDRISVFDQVKINGFMDDRSAKQERMIMVKLQKGTFRAYKNLWKRLLCFVYRTSLPSQAIPLLHQFTQNQLCELDQTMVLANKVLCLEDFEGAGRPNREEEHQPSSDMDSACLQLCICLLYHTQIPKKHKAAVYDKPGSISTKIEETHSGTCHSDMSIMLNSWKQLPFPTQAGQVGGHEGVGKIVKMGPGTENSGVKLGQRVGIKWMAGICETCEACRTGMDASRFSGKFSGYNTPGTFQQYVLGPANYVTPIPNGLDSAAAAPLLCAGVTVHAALRNTNAESGNYVVIMGAGGGLGHLAVQYSARGIGHRVVGIDHSSKKDLVLNSGAKHFIPFDDTSSLAKAVQFLTGGHGAHAVVVCTDSQGAYNESVNLLRFGGRVVCVGIPGGDVEPIGSANANILVAKEIQIVGSAVRTRKEAIETCESSGRGVVKTHFWTEKLEKLTSVFEERKGFDGATLATSDLSALIKLAQLLVLQYAVHEHRSGRADFPGDKVAELQDAFTVYGSDSPINWILNLRNYGTAIRNNTTAAGWIEWSNDGQKLTYKSLELSLHSLRWAIRDQLTAAQEQLNRLLMLPDAEPDARARLVPAVDLTRLKDDPGVSAAGHSFLLDPRNRALLAAGGQQYLLNRIRDSPTLRRRFFLYEDALAWMCQRSRPTFGSSISVFIDNGMLCFVTSYHKNHSTSSTTRIVHRYLPAEVGELLLYYLWLVAPFLDALHVLSEDCAWQAPDNGSYLWPDSLHSQQAHATHRARHLEDGQKQKAVEEPWPSSRLRAVIKERLAAALSTTITVLLRRHAAIAMSRKHLPEGFQFRRDYGAREGDAIMDLQSAYTSKRAAITYARSRDEGPGFSKTVRDDYRSLSRAWHAFLGFGAALPPRDSALAPEPTPPAPTAIPATKRKRERD